MNPVDIPLSLIGRELISEFTKIIYITGSGIHLKDDAQCYIWISDQIVYVIVRGGSCYSELHSDLIGLETADHNRVNVHESFLVNAVEELESNVRLALQNTNCRKIVVSGHGIGGGVASLIAPILAVTCPQLGVHVVTFGSPRVGDESFVRWCMHKTASSFRINLVGDPLPFVPSFTCGYRQIGDSIIVSDKGLQKWSDYECMSGGFSIEEIVSFQNNVQYSINSYYQKILPLL
jgi:hypothetical protein